MIIFTLILFLFVLASLSMAQKSILQTNYITDSESLVYNDSFNIYAGRDKVSPTGKWFNMCERWGCSSVELENWACREAALKTIDFSWASDVSASQYTFYISELKEWKIQRPFFFNDFRKNYTTTVDLYCNRAPTLSDLCLII